MVRKSRKKKVLAELPEQPEVTEKPVENSANASEKSTLTELQIKEDPRYVVLKDSLKDLVDVAPSFESVMQNPWLYNDWRTRVAQLVQ